MPKYALSKLRKRLHIDRSRICDGAIQQSVQSVVIVRKVLIQNSKHERSLTFYKMNEHLKIFIKRIFWTEGVCAICEIDFARNERDL